MKPGSTAAQSHTDNHPHSQRGVVLVVSLLLLALLSVLTVTALHVDTTQLRIIANMQDESSLEALTRAELDQAVEQRQWLQNPTCNPAPYRTVDDHEFDLDEPRCLQVQAASGSSALADTRLEQSLWELRIKGRDNRTGNEMVMRQGVMLYLPVGSCPVQITGTAC
ncbi:MAG: hypothetical protein RLZZ226_153 [Pseudomonadota bacterium]|jgi:hypothetical protein